MTFSQGLHSGAYLSCTEACSLATSRGLTSGASESNCLICAGPIYNHREHVDITRIPTSRVCGCRVQAACSVRPAPAGSRPDRARRRGVSVKAAARGTPCPQRGTRSVSGGRGLDGAPPRARVVGSQAGRQRAVPCMWQPSERARCRGRQQCGPGTGAAPQLRRKQDHAVRARGHYPCINPGAGGGRTPPPAGSS
jgi:hypothetical protein